MLRTPGKRHGFTLVELAIVVVIVGVLAAFAVPKFMTSVERSRAAEAFQRLTSVQTAQERYHALHGTYAHTVRLLDIDIPELEYFETTDIEPSDVKTLEATWSMTFTRQGAAERIGAYTVVFNEAGFDAKRSTISDRPEINPMEANAE